MHNVVLIQHLERINQLLEDQQRFLLRNRLLLPQQSLKSPPIAKLVNKIEVIGRLQHVNILDDMLILLDIRQNVYLVDRTFLQFLVLLESTHLNHLHCVLLVVQLVYSSVDLAISTLADYFVESVVFYYTHHPFKILL